MEEETTNFKALIRELYDKSIETNNKIKEVFEEFFGADNVEYAHYDFDAIYEAVNSYANSSGEEAVLDYYNSVFNSSSFIHIYIPKITVTNEFGRSEDIMKVFVKVCLSSSGCLLGTFKINRSKYTWKQWKNGYMHSHVMVFSNVSVPTTYHSMCLGTGPIRTTITSLTVSQGCDYNLWKLFCVELMKYLETESVAGGPYISLESLSDNSLEHHFSSYATVLSASSYTNGSPAEFFKELFGQFMKYFVSLDKLRFRYANGSYSIGMPYIEYIMTISNAFIDWFNKEKNDKDLYKMLLNSSILWKCRIVDNTICYPKESSANSNYRTLQGRTVTRFKEKDIPLEIIEPELDTDNSLTILNVYVAMSILDNILKVINYEYNRNFEGTTVYV